MTDSPYRSPASAQADKGNTDLHEQVFVVVGAALSADVDAPTERRYCASMRPKPSIFNRRTCAPELASGHIEHDSVFGVPDAISDRKVVESQIGWIVSIMNGAGAHIGAVYVADHAR